MALVAARCRNEAPEMLREVVLMQSAFVDLDSVGFAVAYIKDRDTVRVVGLATVDFGT